ncbi:hypothetical protein SDC9_86359 [bioreactor metagenome]|uniref:Uncharacterized protein n=1 Tax=bioreactor metagenome TaxID=1076179 RepID=A0A644ZFR1_9ZZZZ
MDTSKSSHAGYLRYTMVCVAHQFLCFKKTESADELLSRAPIFAFKEFVDLTGALQEGRAELTDANIICDVIVNITQYMIERFVGSW